MKKIKYYYNTHTLRYEKLITPLSVKLLRVFGFIAASIVTAGIISYLAFRFVGSPTEKILRSQNDELNYQLQQVRGEIGELQQQMTVLEKRDNDVYRSIFEAQPIPDSIRTKQLEAQQEIAKVEGLPEGQVIYAIDTSIRKLRSRIAIQKKSYDQVFGLIKNKEKLLAATPAIQPVSNKDLNRIASGFGYRIDPVYKTVKYHAGLDFAAPQGTPIYATADGVVKEAGPSSGGYGNNVIINHGYGYESLYGHMYRIKTRAGKSVKRGEIIGYVGSTGKSTGPHCHYEVHKYGQRLDPVYFFYNDLGPNQFDELLKRAAASNQSLD
ncbi:MAG: M23 family metallopeptidase [Candidatus Dadabacteria bacterium]